MSFDSGILLCVDTQHPVPARIPRESTKIFPRAYSSDPSGARSVFLVSEPAHGMMAMRQQCERALETLQCRDYTIDRMRTTIESVLLESGPQYSDSPVAANPDATVLVALYSPVDRQCSLFRTTGSALQEFAGYDCQGTAGYFGHCVIRDRYKAAESMDSLDLTTVFSIATDTVESVRECLGGCGEFTEVMVMYANGRASSVERIRRDTWKQQTLAVLGNLQGV
jgi:hypothetical protein